MLWILLPITCIALGLFKRVGKQIFTFQFSDFSTFQFQFVNKLNESKLSLAWMAKVTGKGSAVQDGSACPVVPKLQAQLIAQNKINKAFFRNSDLFRIRVVRVMNFSATCNFNCSLEI